MDLFQRKDKDYLLLMDYHSNYPEFARLLNTTAEQVIVETKAIFARHGIPMTVISDNGPKFKSESFKDFKSALPAIQRLSRERSADHETPAGKSH